MNFISNKIEFFNSMPPDVNPFSRTKQRQRDATPAKSSLRTKVLAGTLATGTFALLGLAAHKGWNTPATDLPHQQGIQNQTLALKNTSSLYDNSTISVISNLPVSGQNTSINFPDKLDMPNQTLTLKDTCSLNDNSTLSALGNLPVSNLNEVGNLFKISINASNITTLVETKTFGGNLTNPFLPISKIAPSPSQTNISSTCSLPPQILAAEEIKTVKTNDTIITNETVKANQSEVIINSSLAEIQLPTNLAGLRTIFERQALAGKFEAITIEQFENLFGKGRNLDAEESRKLYNVIAELLREFGMKALLNNSNEQVSDLELAKEAFQTRHNARAYARTRTSECMQQSAEHFDFLRHKNIMGLTYDQILHKYSANATKIIEQAGLPNKDVNLFASFVSEKRYCQIPQNGRDFLTLGYLKPGEAAIKATPPVAITGVALTGIYKLASKIRRFIGIRTP